MSRYLAPMGLPPLPPPPPRRSWWRRGLTAPLHAAQRAAHAARHPIETLRGGGGAEAGGAGAAAEGQHGILSSFEEKLGRAHGAPTAVSGGGAGGGFDVAAPEFGGAADWLAPLLSPFSELQAALGGGAWPAAFAGGGWPTAPPFNARERDGRWELEVAVPGVPRDALHVRVSPDGSVLEVEGSSAAAEGAAGGEARSYVHATFELPRHVAPGDVQASYSHGMLRLSVPKPAGGGALAAPVDVPIQIAAA